MQYKINLRTMLLTLALAAIVAVPVTAWALGLGQLQSDTRIGQPFSAQIPITGASAGALQGLHVELASPEAYKNANLNQPDYLYSLKFSVEQGPKGPYIKVSSDKPIKLPFLNLLINARWNSGQVTRQYTVLLNPPVFVAGSQSQQPVNAPSSPAVAQQPSPPPQQSQQSAAPEQPAPVRESAPSQPVQQPQVQQQPVQQQPVQPAQSTPATAAQSSAPQQQMSSSPAPGSTYTVQHGDTLWGLARQMRPSNEVSVNQMMVAVYQANPHAFRGNINRLKSGAVLQMPSQSQIAQITAEEATRIVARQNNEWQGEQSATQVASGNAPSSTPGESQAGQATQPQGTGETAESQPQAGAQQQAASAGTAGRVVLTTPEVTATTSAAAAPGSAAASGTASSGAMSGAVASAAASSGHATAQAGQAAGTGASVGGPLKVKSNAMAGLASAGTSSAAASGTATHAVAPAATTASRKPQPKKRASSTANNVNTVNSVNTASSEGEGSEGGSGLMYWIQQPTGWIVIGAVVLLLAALLLFIVRRRKSGADEADQHPLAESQPEEAEGDGHDAGPEASGQIEAGIPHETEGADGQAEGAPAEGDDLGIATYIGGPSLDVNKVDAIDEAELHVGFGDYDKASEVLREAIEHDPSRPQLRRKLLDVLFAAGDATGFASEAAIYRDQVDTPTWEEVAVMGRQLRPQDELFASATASAEAAVADAGSEEAHDDFLDIDLDRLSSATEGGSDQSEFERTMDELSTFIETYVPASTDTPVSLQLPPEEERAAEQARAEELIAVPDDEPLEFTLDDDDLPSPAADTGLAPEEDEEGGDENLVDTKLDLARAYIDMGDSDSARSVLEEVIDEGDDTQSGEARRLLESLA